MEQYPTSIFLKILGFLSYPLLCYLLERFSDDSPVGLIPIALQLYLWSRGITKHTINSFKFVYSVVAIFPASLISFFFFLYHFFSNDKATIFVLTVTPIRTLNTAFTAGFPWGWKFTRRSCIFFIYVVYQHHIASFLSTSYIHSLRPLYQFSV